MGRLDDVEAVLDRHKEGEEELDVEQLVAMLVAAIDGLKNCDADGAAKQMLVCAGYSVR